MRRLFGLLLGLLLASHLVWALEPCQQNHTHYGNSVGTTFNSSSIIGNHMPSDSRSMTDPCMPGHWSPQLEYPVGSGSHYLYMGSLWVGALLEEEDGSLTPRVSFGSEGWERDVTELYPASSCGLGFAQRSRVPQRMACDGLPVFDPAALSDQEYRFTYSDTLADYPNWVDGTHYESHDRNHRPLGIEITQESHQWNVGPALEASLLVHYTIRNIGTQPLRNVHAGLFMEGDVMSMFEDGGWEDDLLLFRAHAITGVADSTLVNAMVFLDNDGRPADQHSGSEFTTPHALAVMPIVEGPHRVSFNWWKSNGSVSMDYGPAWTWWSEHPEYGMAWTDSLGTPVGDWRKFQLLSNGELDPAWHEAQHGSYPPQPVLDAAGNPVEWRTWTPPSDHVNPLGDDVRGLLAVGPLGQPVGQDSLGNPLTMLEPGGHVDFWFALVMGDHVHQSCCPQPDINNSVDPGLFDFTSLDQRLAMVKEMVASGFPVQPMPPVVEVVPVAEGQLHLSWTRQGEETQTWFRLEREHVQSGARTWLADSTTEMEWLDGHALGDSLRYHLSEVWPDGRWATAVVLATPDYPPMLEDLMITPGDGRIDFHFQSGSPGILIVHGVMPESPVGDAYCWPPACPFEMDTTWLANTGSATLTGLENLRRHFIKAQPVAANGLSSDAPWHSCIPHATGETWRVLNHVRYQADSDSAASRAAFTSLFAGAGLELDFQHVTDYYLPRHMLDGASKIWLNQDLRVPTNQFRPLDLLHFQESGGALVWSQFELHGVEVDVALDPFVERATVLRHVPLNISGQHSPIQLPPPWSYRIVDPTLGSLRVDSHQDEFLPFLFRGFADQGSVTSQGLIENSGNEEMDGRCASVTRMDPPFLHLMLAGMSRVDLEDSRSYLENVLEMAQSVDLPPSHPTQEPRGFTLHDCVPNPFNPITKISYHLAHPQEVALRVYNLQGQLVRELLHGEQPAGYHQATLEGNAMASGLYVITLEAGGGHESRKVLLVR